METVRFDLERAPRLADEMERGALEVGAARARLARLLAEAGRPDAAVTRLLDGAVEWGMVAAADLRWRLDWLAQCQVDLPNVSFTTGADGMVRADLPFRDRTEADRWVRGARTHRELVAALAAVDGQRAEEVLDDLESLLDDPLALAGFAGALGASGLGDLVDRIDDARRRDPVNTLGELWHRGTNPRWDDLDARLADIASRAGGLASYGADDAVEVRFHGGGLVVTTMRDLLLESPHDLAGNWSHGLDMVDQPVLVMGGALATMRPQGPNVTGSGLLVPRVPEVPGASFWWDDDAGELQTWSYDVPNTAVLVGRTADQLVTNPIESVQYAWSRPDDMRRGFFQGAGLAVLVVGGWAAAGGAAAGGTLLGGGTAVTGAQVTTLGVVVNGGKTLNEAVTAGPCRGQRVAAAGASMLMGPALSGAFAEGGLDGLAYATDVAAEFDFLIPTNRC